MKVLKRFFNLLRCHKAFLMVVLGCLFLILPPPFSSVKLLYVLSVWLWPFCFLYYGHRSKKSYTQTILFLFLLLGVSVRFYGIISSDLAGARGLVMVFASCIFWIPFVWDAAYCNHDSPFAYTLVFPSIYCTMNLILSACNVIPICSLAYAQYDNKPLLQLASVIGEFGITFLITWTASVGIYVVERWKTPHGKRVGLIALIVLVLLHIGGLVRYNSWPEPSSTVRVAQAIGPKLDQDKNDWEILPYERNVASFEKIVVSAFEKGSEILVFSEEAFTIEDGDEERFLDNAKEMARKFSLPILMTLEIPDLDNDMGGKLINKALLIDKYGNIVAEYLKHNAIPVAESDGLVNGDGKIPMINLFIGGSAYNVSFVICYDGNFSDFIREMNSETQLYFNPSWDWKSIDDYHYRFIGVRSVEMGVNLVMTTNDGYSLVSDPVGKEYVLNRIDKLGLDQVYISEVPTESTETIYSKAGGLLNMIYPIMLLIFIVFGERRGWRRKIKSHKRKSKDVAK